MRRLLSLLFVLLILTECHQEVPLAPVASFTFTVGLGASSLEVTFVSTTQNAKSYTWDFDDGQTGTGATVKHTYTATKMYSVKLIAKGDGGNSGSTQSVTIQSFASPPVADFSFTGGGCTASCEVSFTNKSTGAATGYLWNFGDNTATSTDINPKHTYQKDGTFTVTLIATGPGGTSSPKSQIVVIVAPVVTTRQYLNLSFATMNLIKGGTFQMGDTRNEGESDEKPVHSVTLSDFYMGQYEVTQRQWQAMMGSNPSYFTGCDDCPVEEVSWDDAQAFIAKLNQQRLTGTPAFRLPTEAEWEYAAGGGAITNRTRFGNGKDIANPSETNYDGSDYSGRPTYSVVGIYRQKTVQVGSFSPNSLGLHDMSGNVGEWCSDWYAGGYYASSGSINPAGPGSGSGRVFRGGSWFNHPADCRSASRRDAPPADRYAPMGFRVVSQSQ